MDIQGKATDSEDTIKEIARLILRVNDKESFIFALFDHICRHEVEQNQLNPVDVQHPFRE